MTLRAPLTSAAKSSASDVRPRLDMVVVQDVGHLFVVDLMEIAVELPDGEKIRRSLEAHDIVSLRTHRLDRFRGGYRDSENEPFRSGAAHAPQRCPD